MTSPTQIKSSPIRKQNRQPTVPSQQSNYLESVLLVTLGAPAVLMLVVGLAHIGAASVAAGASVFLSLALSMTVLAFASAVVFLANPMHALLSLIGVFISAVFVYLALGAEFLGLVFLIVYVGAVAILFIFVIMLLNVKSLTQKTPASARTAQLIGSVLAILLVKVGLSEVAPSLAQEITARMEAFSLRETAAEELAYFIVYHSADVQTLVSLYNTHAGLFVIITIILLAAMLGAIVLATTTLEEQALPVLPEDEKVVQILTVATPEPVVISQQTPSAVTVEVLPPVKSHEFLCEDDDKRP